MKKYRTSVSLLSLIGLLSLSFSSNAKAIEKGDYYCYRTTTPGKNEAISEYDFFTIVDENGKESIVYCYNATRPQPLSNKETAEKLCRFDRFGFYEGMDSLGTDRGNKEKINQIAAILMAGYPNDGLGEQMNQYAYECYQKVHRDYTYTFDDFKREMTQRAIWKADRPRGKYTDHYPYAEALYRYGKQYPLDQQTAYDDQLFFQTNTNEIIDPQHPMIIDEKTRKSNQFQIKNYNGLVSIENPSTEVKIIEEQSHKEVTTLKPNTYYYAELTNGQQKESTLDIKYMKMDHSYFYQYATSPYPFGLQNMVQANIKKKKLPIDIKIEPVTSSSEESSKEVETSKDTPSSEESSKAIDTTSSNKDDSSMEVPVISKKECTSLIDHCDTTKEVTTLESTATQDQESTNEFDYSSSVENSSQKEKITDSTTNTDDKENTTPYPSRTNPKIKLQNIKDEVIEDKMILEEINHHSKSKETKEDIENELPQTGNKISYLFPLLGTLICIVSISLLLLLKKHTHKKK